MNVRNARKVQNHFSCEATKAICTTLQGKHSDLTRQEVADLPFLVAMATTHRSRCHFPELCGERSVQSGVI